jgi:DNA-3-methyladenine glycosylase II
MTNTFRLVPRGPYALDASARFLCGFTPAAGSSTTLEDGRLAIGFLDETRHVPIAIALRQEAADGDVTGELSGDGDAPAIARQVARILSLDHDAHGLRAIAASDPVVARLLATAPGCRPVCFPSPYEAAVWAVLAQRISMNVASSLKQRLAIATATIAEGFGRRFHPSPAPARLLALEDAPWLPAEKLARLHAVARAALDGELDATRLRALPLATALDRLRSIRGVGPWTAEHIVMRGCGVIDELPTAEPRVLRAIAEAYGLGEDLDPREAQRIAEGWAPFRMWIAVLLVMNLRGTPGWRTNRHTPVIRSPRPLPLHG